MNSRERFERFCRIKGWKTQTYTSSNTSSYTDDITQASWEAWQWQEDVIQTFLQALVRAEVQDLLSTQLKQLVQEAQEALAK